MRKKLSLRESDFCLEFFQYSGNIFKDNPELREEISSNDNIHVLQEIIIVPPGMTDSVHHYSAHNLAPLRCNRPLVFLGGSGLPVQYSSITARLETGNPVVEKNDNGIKINADQVTLLYGAPIFSTNTSHVFADGFAGIRNTLRSFRMKESTIARTWLFMKDILRDYDELNKAREDFFAEWRDSASFFPPASTGIQNRIIGGEMLAFAFCAFSGDHVKIRKISSPLQNEPATYGKLFSRAVVVEFSRSKLLLISGTASINKAGDSVYAEDFESQMEFTLEIISAILKQENCGFTDVVQAIVYLKRGEDMNACLRILDRTGFPKDKALFQVNVDVCRDDLLCEIEATAVMNKETEIV